MVSIYSLFVVRVVLISHLRAGYGCVRVISACAEQKRWNALVKMHLGTHRLQSDNNLAYFLI